MKFLRWNDLTEEEKEQATESYIAVREWEEERNRDDVTSNTDYDNPIDVDMLECCRFKRTESGYIEIYI